MPPQHSVLKPRILMAAYQIRNLSNGGMESATRIFEALQDEFDWSLMTTRELPRTQRWRAFGARVAIAPFDDLKPRWSRRLAGLAWSLRFALEIVRFRPDIVHCNDIQSYQAYAFLPKRLRRAPLIFTLRGMRPHDDPYPPIWSRLAQDASAVVVLSEEMGNQLAQRLTGLNGKLTVIHSIVDIEAIAPPSTADRAAARRKLGLAEGELAIGCIGAIREKKGQLGILEEIVPQLAKRFPRARVHFLGDADPSEDTFCSRFLSIAKKSDSDEAFAIHGHCDNLHEWYAALDLTVIASETEGLSRAMIESMAAGIPVASTAVCSAKEMLEPTGAGKTVRINDFEALGDALITFGDAQTRRQAGNAGRKVAVALFSEQQVAKSWAGLYRSIAKLNS